MNKEDSQFTASNVRAALEIARAKVEAGQQLRSRTLEMEQFAVQWAQAALQRGDVHDFTSVLAEAFLLGMEVGATIEEHDKTMYLRLLLPPPVGACSQ